MSSRLNGTLVYDCYNWYSLKENIWIFQMFSFLIDDKEILIGYIVGLVLLLRILFSRQKDKISVGVYLLLFVIQTIFY